MMTKSLKGLLIAAALSLASVVRAQGGTIGGGGISIATITATTFDSVKATKLLFGAGTAAAPSLAPLNSRTSGLYRFGSDTLGFATSGVATMRLSGGNSAKLSMGSSNGTICLNSTDDVCISRVGSDVFRIQPNVGVVGMDVINLSGAPTWRGGAASLIVQAGTGNSRTMTLQSTNSSGTATTFASGSGDTAIFAGHMSATGLSSEASTQSAVCVTNGGGQVFINAAATCTVSGARYKRNIGVVAPSFAWNIIRRVPVDSFAYKEGGTRAFGTIADSLALIDERLVTRTPDGKVHAANYEQLTVLLISVVQEQQKRLDTQENLLWGLGAAGVGGAGVAGAAARKKKAEQV
jgi:hypothetical protein